MKNNKNIKDIGTDIVDTTVNLYKKPSTKTENVTQMIYGDKFTIYRKTSKIDALATPGHLETTFSLC